MPRVRVEEAPLETEGKPHLGPFKARLLSDAGGLTQFGARLETLPSGSTSSDRHWHEAEDEFAYVLEGEPILVEDGSETVLRAGDTAAWPAGVANAHHLVNRSDAPARFLVVGTRPERNVVRYPDLGRTLHHAPDRWRLLDDATGAVLREGSP